MRASDQIPSPRRSGRSQLRQSPDTSKRDASVCASWRGTLETKYGRQRFTFLVLGGIVIAGALIATILQTRVSFEERFEARVTQLINSGDLVVIDTEVDTPVVADENAVVWLERADEVLKDYLNQTGSRFLLLPADDPNHLSSEERERFPRAVADLASYFALLDRAMMCSQYVTSYTPVGQFEAERRDLVGLRNAARLLYNAMVVSEDDATLRLQVTRSVNLVVSVQRMITARDPMEYLGFDMAWALVLGGVHRTVNRISANMELLNKVRNELEVAVDALPSIEQALRDSRAFDIAVVRGWANGAPLPQRGASSSGGPVRARLRRETAFEAGGEVLGCYDRVFKAIRTANQGEPGLLALMKECRIERDESEWARFLLSGTRNMVRFHLRVLGMLRVARVALACSEFRARRGRWPSGFEELGSSPEVRRDPLSGGYIRWVSLGDEIQLCAVDPDLAADSSDETQAHWMEGLLWVLR